ncbi:MAG TPA: saccharopine dehydrogenase NADP-binding domain-containing protein [Chthoniobacterales bacterium]
MNANRFRENKPVVAVFGAAGHTGRFVVRELLRREIVPIAIARDLAALSAANFGDFEVTRRRASVDDADSLDRALDGARAVINCAGPFLETNDALAAAALRAGVHYVDVTAEQPSVRATIDKYDRPARKAGIAVLPGMGFYGGFADLLVSATLGDWDSADRIEIMVGLDSWHPTRGTRVTGERNTARRMVIANGQLTLMPLPPAEKDWEFADPLGRQAMVEVPLSEVILIARHVKTAELHTYLSSNAISDIDDPATPAPKSVDGTGRSSQRFVVDAVIRRDGKTRRITAQGRDIYAFTAPLVCEATARLLEGKFSNAGGQAPGVIFDAHEFLSALAPDHLTFGITAS